MSALALSKKARVTRAAFTLLIATSVCGVVASAQDGAPKVSVGVAPSIMYWSFKTPIAQDSFKVRGVSEFVVPFAVSVPIATRWSLDASGAYEVGKVSVTDNASASRDLSLSGPTDIKLRVVGRARGDRFRLTLGVNAPTGSTRLTGTDIDAIRILGAPALRMPIASLGNGFGATAGVVVAAQAAQWALAFGTSYELRGSYSPIEASIAGVALPTDLNPADALHFTVGADRIVRAGRVSFLVGTDIYGEDELTVSRSGGSSVSGTYKLGPSVTALSAIEFGVRGFREFSLVLMNRYRTAFRGVDGKTAAGSAGNFLDANIRAVSGAPRRLGMIYGLDAHLDSGQEVDNSIATAAITSFGATLGVSIPAGLYALQPFVRGQYGSLDTGLASTTISGFSVGITLTAR